MPHQNYEEHQKKEPLPPKENWELAAPSLCGETATESPVERDEKVDKST